MKKLLLTICLFSFSMLPSLAQCNYSSYCSQESYGISSPCSRFVQKITGMNFFSQKIAQAIIKKELKKAVKENLKVQMEIFSAKDLAQGKFKSLRFSGKNLNFDGVYVTKLESKSLCDFNFVEVKKNEIKFKENFVMDFSFEVSDKDLRKTVSSAGYIDMLNRINFSSYGVTFFKLSSTDVQIENNKLLFTINVTTPFSSAPFPIKLTSGIKVQNGKIILTQTEFVNSFKLIDLNKMTYLINALNPLNFTTNILNNKAKVKMETVDIIDNKILINGYILIPKNTIEKG